MPTFCDIVVIHTTIAVYDIRTTSSIILLSVRSDISVMFIVGLSQGSWVINRSINIGYLHRPCTITAISIAEVGTGHQEGSIDSLQISFSVCCTSLHGLHLVHAVLVGLHHPLVVVVK